MSYVGHNEAWHSERQKIAVEKSIDLLKKFGLHKFGAIAYTGISGAMIAPVIAFVLDKHQFPIRKKYSEHSDSLVEGPYCKISYVIIDDFVQTGDTIRYIYKNIYEERSCAECVGFLSFTDASQDKPSRKSEVEIDKDKKIFSVDSLIIKEQKYRSLYENPS